MPTVKYGGRSTVLGACFSVFTPTLSNVIGEV